MSNGAQRIIFGVTIDYQLRYHDGLWEKLLAEGWDVHIATTHGENLEGAASKGAHVHAIPMSRDPAPRDDLKAFTSWLRILRSVGPDTVVLGTPKAALIGLFAAKVCGVKRRIYELHGLRLEGAKGFKQRVLTVLERFTCSLATTVVPVSDSLARQLLLRKITRPRKIQVLGRGSPNGVDIDHFRKAREDQDAAEVLRRELALVPNIPIVIFVGRLSEDKGLTCLAQALRLLSTEDAQILIVGPFDDAAGQLALDSIRSSGLRVTATGDVNDVAPYLALADVLCLPSKREGLPTVVLEAFASSVPVVGTRATGIVDLIAHGQTGSLVNIDDSKGLAKEIIRILGDRKTARKYARNALVLVQSHYTQDYVQKQWTSFLAP